MTFTGIPAQGFEFLLNLRFNNNREWFAQHKEQYQTHVRRPMSAMIAELSAMMLAVDPQIETRPNRALSRIYRDARRLRGRDFYRDEAWFTFRRQGEAMSETMGFYFYINPEQYGWGLGVYGHNPQLMAGFRARVDADPHTLLAIGRKLHAQGYALSGEHYKRPKRVWEDPLLHDWYNRKSIGLFVDRAVDQRVFTPAVLDEVRQAFTDFAPLYQFIML